MSKPDSAGAVLSVRRLFKAYPRRSLFGRAVIETHAVQNVDLDLAGGETLAIVGSSGAGKTTLGRCIAGLEQPTSGEIRYCGETITPANAHRHIQMVFQDAGASLNPRFTVADALCEPAVIQSRGVDRQDGAGTSWTGRPASKYGNRSTPALSGGQKARLAIARALAALGSQAPAVLILDESLGSLDLSTRAQIINLFVDLQEQQALTYILDHARRGPGGAHGGPDSGDVGRKNRGAAQCLSATCCDAWSTSSYFWRMFLCCRLSCSNRLPAASCRSRIRKRRASVRTWIPGRRDYRSESSRLGYR